jgi:hypothetical protein
LVVVNIPILAARLAFIFVISLTIHGSGFIYVLVAPITFEDFDHLLSGTRAPAIKLLGASPEAGVGIASIPGAAS